MPKLKETLSLFDAVSVGLGAIIGAGIFIILGFAIEFAGPAVLISIMLAAFISFLTSISFIELSKRITKEGGAYTFVHDVVSPFAGYIVGFFWVSGNIILASTVSLGFAHYLHSILQLPILPTAIVVCALATLINYQGIKKFAEVNDLLVLIKICVLLFFVSVSLFFFKPHNFVPFLPFGFKGVLSSAALIFFAFGGFGRVTTVSEETISPEKTIPRAILISLFISTLIYILVSVGAISLAGLHTSSAYLSFAISKTNIPGLDIVIVFGALVATASVLLTAILGVSRVIYAMARNSDMPPIFAELDQGIPKKAIIFTGLIVFLFILVGDMKFIASLTSFSLLFYYAATNYAAMSLETTTPKYLFFIAILFCLILAFSLSIESIISGFFLIFLAVVYYKLKKS